MSINNFRKLLTERRKTREKGNSLVLYILWMPLLFGSFGVAVDSAVAIYTASTLQSGLDTAAQSALSRAVNPGTGENTSLTPQLTYEAARDYTIAFYDANRSEGKNPFIKCQTSLVLPSDGSSGTAMLVRPPSGCAWTQLSYGLTPTPNGAEVNVTITEQSGTVFMHMVGVSELKYKISSSARVTYEIG